MAGFEQIPVAGENNADRIGEKTEIITDANVVTNEDKEKTESGGDTVQTDPERNSDGNSETSKEEAELTSDKILESPEIEFQINQLKNLGEMYKKGELKDIQQKQYEDLMTTIRAELDRDVPSVVEMNKEIDINYYNANPTEAANEAERITNDHQNMNDAQLVGNVISRREYLGRDSKQKLDSIINNVIKSLDEDTKSILKKQSREV